MTATQQVLLTNTYELSETEIGDRLVTVLCDALGVTLSAQDFSDDTNLYELGLESLKVIEVLSTIEKTFDIIIDVEDLSAELFARFDNVVQFVKRKIHESR